MAVPNVAGSSKGSLRQFATWFVIAFMAVILLGMVVERVGVINIGTVDLEKCKAAVESAARANLGKKAFVEDVNCETWEDDVKDVSNDKAREIIAENMATCWDVWGEGKLELFSEDGTYCHVCSIIDVEQDINGLSNYLQEKTVKDGTGRTYAQYLQGYSNDAAANSNLDQALSGVLDQSRPLEEGKQYATLFVYGRGTDGIQDTVRFFTSEANGRATLMVGATAGVGTSAALTAMVVTATVGGPPGWIVAGVGLAGIGIVTGVGYLGDTYLNDPNVEWASFTILEEWDEQTAERLQNGMGCTVLG